jgi:tetratricopeptide (TPR) repeat protein
MRQGDSWSIIEVTLQEREKRIARAIELGDESDLRTSRDFAEFAIELARVGRWKEAETAAEAIDDRGERHELLANLARELIKAARIDDALALLVEVPDDVAEVDALTEKVDTLIKGGAFLAASGDAGRAESVVEMALRTLAILAPIAPPWVEVQYLLESGQVLASVAKRDTATKLFDDAAELALETDDVDCGKLLGEIALAYLAAGERGRAEHLEKRIWLPHVRARVKAALDDREE